MSVLLFFDKSACCTLKFTVKKDSATDAKLQIFEMLLQIIFPAHLMLAFALRNKKTKSQNKMIRKEKQTNAIFDQGTVI